MTRSPHNITAQDFIKRVGAVGFRPVRLPRRLPARGNVGDCLEADFQVDRI